MALYTYIVTIETDTPEHADEVIAERVGYDDDYGFDYRINALGRVGRDDTPSPLDRP